MTVAVGPVGTVIGCFGGGVLGQRLGTRNALRYAAALYFAAAVVQLIVVVLFYPETKGQTLEQLQGKLMRS